MMFTSDLLNQIFRYKIFLFHITWSRSIIFEPIQQITSII